jgi:beta-galactosidase
MKRISLWLLVLCFSIISSYSQSDEIHCSRQLFDFGWKFILGDPSGAEAVDFNDSQWRSIQLPHDFSIEQPFDVHNLTGKEGGYTYSGVGWYRKTFKLKLKPGQRACVQFNGIYRNSDVWINGHHLGFRPYGYSTFVYDLTPYLNTDGAENVLAVKVNTLDQPSSRWYTGSGIYRHVWLFTTGNAWFATGGVFATTRSLDNKQAVVDVTCEIVGKKSGKYTLKTQLINKDGQIISSGQTDVVIKKGDTLSVGRVLTIKSPQFWTLDNPHLYQLQCSLTQKKEITDRYTCNVGLRTFRFDPDKGFFLNGTHVKIKGVNNHHDGGPLGAACADYTFERQVRILKSMGANALRMSHNPPAPELLDCADSMGLLVIDEIFDEWLNGKTPHGYAPFFKEWHSRDMTDWVRRDRNHPSIIAWSVGNEIPEQSNAKSIPVLKDLIQLVKQQDTTRPVTMAVNEIPRANKSGFTQLLDIVGYNYQEPNYEKDHKAYPRRIIFGTETTIYPYHPGGRFPLHSYSEWLTGQQEDYVAGEFLWTGFDYIGESGIGAGGYNYEPWKYWPLWPWRSAICGVVDLCGFEKPAYWFRKAIWSNEPVLFVAVQTDTIAQYPDSCSFWGWPKVQAHWNGKIPGEKLAVHVYTNCKTVELFINNRSLGMKEWNLSEGAFLTWNVPYEPGELRAEGITIDGARKSFTLKTAGVPAKIVISTDRQIIKANGQDVAYIKAELFDKDNVPVLSNSDTIEFEVSGTGKMLAVGNGNPASHTSFKGNKIETWQGKCLAILRDDAIVGEIIVKAKGKHIESNSVEIMTK